MNATKSNHTHSGAITAAAGLLALALALASCGGGGILISRGANVPHKLQTMSEEELLAYFGTVGEKGYKDGTSLTVKAIMVDMAYLKTTGQTLDSSDEEMQALSSRKRFDVHVEYMTRNLFPGDTEVAGIDIDKWKVTLKDSTGTQIAPSSFQFDPVLVQKQATTPEAALEDDMSKLVLTYILEGKLIFEYQVPPKCSWIEIVFEPPITGHDVSVRWEIGN